MMGTGIVKYTTKYLPICLMLLAFACSRPQPVVEIATHHWPEGSAVSLMRDGKVVARSSLYGEKIKITAPRPGTYVIRVSSREALTAFSPALMLEKGTTAYALPIPVMRRRIGTTNLGYGFTAPRGDAVSAHLIESSPSDFTHIAVEPGISRDLEKLVSAAHSKGIEALLRSETVNSGRRESMKDAASLINTAERCGADGVVWNAGKPDGMTGKPPAGLREIIAMAHERGLTFSIALEAADTGAWNPVAFFDSIPAPECPDDLVIVVRGLGTSGEATGTVSIDEVENAVVWVRDGRIPLSRVTIEIYLSAAAFSRPGPSGRKAVPLSAGTLVQMIAGPAKDGVLRLPDGSLRLSDGSVDYSWDDMKSIAGKLAFLRTGEFARLRGVRVMWDGLGVSPDPDGVRMLCEVFQGKAGQSVVSSAR